MKVLHIANDYYGSKLYRNLFEKQNSNSIQTSIVVPLNYKYSGVLEDNVINLPCFNMIDRICYFTKQRKIVKGIRKRVDISTYNVTHAHTLFSAGYAAFQLKKVYNIPYVVAVRNTDVNLFFNRMIHLRGLGVHVLEHADRIIFLSPVYAETVIKKFVPDALKESIARKIEIIPNGIDDFFFQNISRESHELGNRLRIIHVGDINRNKNIASTIVAINSLVAEGKEISFTVVGDIKDKKLNRIIENTKYIRYYNKCPREHVLSSLRDADILVMPSHHETFGLVYAEAMSQGLPVIYTKGQGFDGQFEEGTVGYHVNSKDPKDIAEKIKMVLENYEQLSNNCLSSVGKFDWKRIAEQYESVYKDILEQVSD